MLSTLFPWLPFVTQSSAGALLSSALMTILVGPAWLAYALRHRPQAEMLRTERDLVQLHYMVDRLRSELRVARTNGDSADHLVTALNRIRLQLPHDDLRR